MMRIGALLLSVHPIARVAVVDGFAPPRSHHISHTKWYGSSKCHLGDGRLARSTLVRCRASAPSAPDVDAYRSQPDVDDGLGPLDFGVTDSLSVPDDARPSLTDAVSNPRDMLAIVLLVSCGVPVAVHNILGVYGPTYELVQEASVFFGALSFVATIMQLQLSYQIAKRPRMGVIDDAALTAYAGLYSGAATWLALRTSTFCPSWLASFDGVLPWLAAGIFASSLAAPAVTRLDHFTGDEEKESLSTRMVQASRLLSRQSASQLNIPATLSKNELFRSKGLLFIGVIGCVFVPACLAFGLQGQEWWNRVTELHDKQTLLESTDALFALFATEASMVATRVSNAGVAPYRKTVPAFGVVCLALALVPCICSLYWLGGDSGDISFFGFYTE